MQHVALRSANYSFSITTYCASYDDKKDRLVSWKFDIFLASRCLENGENIRTD